MPLSDLVEALEKRLGLGRSLTTAEAGRAEAAIVDAANLVREEARREVEWVEPADFPDVVITIVLEAAKRAYLNPGSYTSETSGPFTVRRDQVGMYLTEPELAIVRRYRPESTTNKSGLWTQPTTRMENGNYVWVDDQYGGDSILYGEY